MMIRPTFGALILITQCDRDMFLVLALRPESGALLL